MGMQIEFNWYIIVKQENLVNKNTMFELREGVNYEIKKDNYRNYPMETPLPMIYNGKCLAMSMIKKLQWSNNKTHLTIEPILVLNEEDPVREYYESSFKKYKRQQQALNDGGKVDVRDMVTPISRTRI